MSKNEYSFFIMYIVLFSFFMYIFLLTNDLVLLLIGWEGIGFCSFMLISFWFLRTEATKAAFKAVSINKISDLFLIAAVIVLLGTSKSSNILVIKATSLYLANLYIINQPLINICSIFLIIASFGKSAQIGFHLWLVDAMEGPTPVSALIHSSTW